MNPSWVGWVIVGIMTIMSIVLLMGKGSFLIAGYNLSNKDVKVKYYEKKLCRVIGAGTGLITMMVALTLYYDFKFPYKILEYMIPWGIFIVIMSMFILSNTICRRK